MAEPKEPKRPSVGAAGKPLPRLWKSEPEEPADDEAPGKKKKKGKAGAADKPSKASSKAGSDKKKDASLNEDGEKTVLKEETPTFDTYEARQRVRIIAGVAVLSVSLVVGYLFVSRFMGGSDLPEGEATLPPEVLAGQSPAGTQQYRDEDEAKMLFDHARDVSSKNTELAKTLLKRLLDKYPKTRSAALANEIFARVARDPGLSLFPSGPEIVASPSSPTKPSAEPVKPTVIEASKTAPVVVVQGKVNLEAPANPPEPTVATAPAQSAANVKESRPLPKGFEIRPGSEIHESGWPLEIVGRRDGAPMVLVPAGKFIQGRDDSDSNEAPAHDVTLSTYYIDRHEVTVRQFNLFQKEAGKRTERAHALAKDPAMSALDAEEDRPVVMVSARDAKDFADWAGKFLPTEAQWEAAARTPDGRIFPWGPQAPNWIKPRAPRQIDPVMTYPSDVSAYGAFDLAGNAWEWTKDWYDPKYYVLFRMSPANNPTGPFNRPRTLLLTVKGIAKDWSVSKREGLKFETRTPYLGFRCVLQVEGPGNAFEPPPAAPAPGRQGAPAPGGGVVVPF